MELPVFDASRLDDPDAIRMLNAACEKAGFFYIAEHGIDDGLLGAAREQMRLLFALPLADRMAIALERSDCHHGYEPMQAQRLEAGAPPDLKEGFYIGNEVGPDHPHVRAEYFNQGPNQWPAALPAFRPAMEAYFAALDKLARRAAWRRTISPRSVTMRCRCCGCCTTRRSRPTRFRARKAAASTPTGAA